MVGGGIPCLVVPHWLNLKEFNFSYLVYCLRINLEDGTRVGLWEVFSHTCKHGAEPGLVECSVRVLLSLGTLGFAPNLI